MYFVIVPLSSIENFILLGITALAVIRKRCPCNVYPLIPHFYIAKLGYAGVYLFLLFLLQNIDCRYMLEPPQRGISNVPTIYALSKSKKNNKRKKNCTESFKFLQLKKILYITWACFHDSFAEKSL